MTVPACHSRREIAGQTAYFFCAHPRIYSRGSLVTEGVCSICNYWREPPPAEFRTMPQNPLIRLTSACQHLGGQIGLRDCPTCRGNVQVKVFQCVHPSHTETTLSQCAACSDFVPLSDRHRGKEVG